MTKKLRFEFKYELSSSRAYLIEKEIVKYGMRPDPNIGSANGEYFVNSLYYDSYALSDYADKAGGFIKRKKFRLRAYKPTIGESKTVWLEIKNKFRQENFKTRILLDQDEFKDFFRRGNTFLVEKKWEQKDSGKKNEILWNAINYSIKPAVAVRYKRRAYLNESQDLRITFDSDLEACRGDNFMYNSFMKPVNRGKVVMEVKYRYLLPFWLKGIVSKYSLKVDTYSKYEKSIDVLRWFNPVLR
ncbi:MAG: polyphosphate polymerase domain-containing protein [Candidatus Yanofskybacteria bacterium]|nr:polyphosphate polymerase domain-containing protein [Candidatus Yanofskybacteria bacterium]